jgi:H+/Cl- antiporter ClcA
MIFMSAALTTLFSSVTMELLCMASGISSSLFGFTVAEVMPVKYMWSALLVGLVSGGFAILFTKSYKAVNKLLGRAFSRIPFILRIVLIFVSVAVIGLLSAELVGTGHHLVDELIEGHGVWYLLIIYLLVRSIFLMIANTQGVTGGLFIPSLAIGAMIGSLCAKGMISIGILPEKYAIVCVIIGMVSFLAASSRVPITALAFSLEALSGFSNFLPIAIGVAVAFTVIETVGIHSFNDTVVDMKIAERNRGKEVYERDVELIVMKDAFVIGREVRDILWPPECLVVSMIKNPDSPHDRGGIGEGDMLCVHYRTAHPEFIADRLEELVGKQHF